MIVMSHDPRKVVGCWLHKKKTDEGRRGDIFFLNDPTEELLLYT